MVKSQPKFGRQFKDILNRNIYKRLGDAFKLAKDPKTFHKEIFLDDASQTRTT